MTLPNSKLFLTQASTRLYSVQLANARCRHALGSWTFRSFVLSTYKEIVNVNIVAPGCFRRFYATAGSTGRSVEPVRLADVMELIMHYCAQESITFIVAVLQIFWQFSNPKGLNPLPNFREQVCYTPVVTYRNPKAALAKAHRARQIESISSTLMQAQKSMFKDPVIIEIKGEHYVKCDCIFTTSTCPEAGGYDILFAGAHLFCSHFRDVRAMFATVSGRSN